MPRKDYADLQNFDLLNECRSAENFLSTMLPCIIKEKTNQKNIMKEKSLKPSSLRLERLRAFFAVNEIFERLGLILAYEFRKALAGK